jgi:nucleoside-diphosphate-sugar epimerase
MNVVIFGATGMVGQGVLREAIQDPDVKRIVSIVRKPTGRDQEKVREVVHGDMWNFVPIESELRDLDACLFCLGRTSAGLTEAEYEHITYGITMAAAETLSRLNPGMTFVFVSGAGTDSTETGKTMWARVKGKTENALTRLPFKASYAIRPAAIRAMHGEVSRTLAYRILYMLLFPIWILGDKLWPKYFTTTERLGRAMLRAAKVGAPKKILESADINALGA